MVAGKRRKHAARIGLAVALIFLAGCAWRFSPAAWHRQPVFGKEASAIGPDETRRTTKPATLRIVSWNVWAIPFATPERRRRLEAIARLVASKSPDIACFQEVFLEQDRTLLCEELSRAGLAHYRYFSSLPCGSGLLTVSRHPIAAATFHRFSRGGDPLAFRQGDWWAGKGAGAVIVSIPDFGEICVVNTHLHARYNAGKYAALRRSQLDELMAFTSALSTKKRPTILAGDLNYRLTEKAWKDAMRENGLQPLTRPWSPIDYILAIRSAAFHYTVLSDDKLQGSIPGIGSATIPCSDHKGLFGGISIFPAADESH